MNRRYTVSKRIQKILDQNKRPYIDFWEEWTQGAVRSHKGVLIDDDDNVYLLDGVSDIGFRTGHEPRLSLLKKPFWKLNRDTKKIEQKWLPVVVRANHPIIQELKGVESLLHWTMQLDSIFERLLVAAEPI